METRPMNCGAGQISAWVRLYHPRGPQVTLPLPDDPAAAFAALDRALDAGWLATAPGLDAGEEKEQVGWVLRGVFSNEQEETPFVLLYAANDALKWSFLKVYLNTDADIQAFEYASKMKLADLPEYVGNDKPQRGAAAKTDKFIVAAPRPFGVVMRPNPKHDDTEQGKMKPKRLFVRWENVRPPAAPEQAAPAEGKANPAHSSLPSNGGELLRRLQEYENRLAGQGVCKVGELVRHVLSAGVKAGHPAVMAEWAGPAMQLAVDEAKAFEASKRKPQPDTDGMTPEEASGQMRDALAKKFDAAKTLAELQKAGEEVKGIKDRLVPADEKWLQDKYRANTRRLSPKAAATK